MSALEESGIFPDGADRVAREWLEECETPLLDEGFCDRDAVALAALLRARDAATWKRACDAIRRENEDALADMLAERGPK